MAPMSRLLAFIAGAVSVGAVVGVLAIAGVVGGSDTTIVRSQPTPTAPAPRSGDTIAAVSDVYARVSPGVEAADRNGPGVRFAQAEQALDRRRLAGAIRAQQPGDAAVARASLYPLGFPQERALNGVPLIARHGKALYDAVLSEAAKHASSLV